MSSAGRLLPANVPKPAPGGRRPGRAAAGEEAGLWVNDVHAQLNQTRVAALHRPTSTRAVQRIVRRAREEGLPVCVAGARHAMGGQQFGTDMVLVDTRSLDRMTAFDPERGTVEVEAGIQWPALIDALRAAPPNAARPWGIRQKQTGADRLSLGGALAANVHGRGLAFPPIVDDIESFDLVDAEGEVRRCSRRENKTLFALAIGGYGLFGVVVRLTLRLAPRHTLRRVVEIRDLEDLMPAFEARRAAGYLYGDFQFSTDPASRGFLRRGVFSCYEPVAPQTPVPANQKRLSRGDWLRLLTLGHVDKAKAFTAYCEHYLATSGQIYHSDTHQLAAYVDDYHRVLDRRLGAATPASEMITEIFVPRPALGDFMEAVRRDFLRHRVDFIYGTVRLVEEDRESFLAWARRPYACVVFNLHVPHSPDGLKAAQRDFRRLIDRGLEHGGSFFLTYHRWATRDQVAAAHPRFPAFLHRKLWHDPEERFQSTWYRHHKRLFRDVL